MPVVKKQPVLLYFSSPRAVRCTPLHKNWGLYDMTDRFKMVELYMWKRALRETDFSLVAGQPGEFLDPPIRSPALRLWLVNSCLDLDIDI